MNRHRFTEYIQHPDEYLNEQSLSELQNVLGEYPFFQSARMLLIKNLHLLDHIKYNSELKLAAAHLSDREKLFFLINDYSFDSHIAETVTAEPNVKNSKLLSFGDKQIASGNSFDIDDLPLSTPPPVIDLPEPQKKAVDEKQKTDAAIKPAVLPSADLLDYERGDNVYFDLSSLDVTATDEELHSFSTWLKLMRSSKTAPSPAKNTDEETSPSRNKNMILIDNFLQKGNLERIKVNKDDTGANHEDFSTESLRENDDLMTETLADIYIRQKLFQKSINIFEQLCLKYPEKSIYFARRIKEVEELIDNHK